MILTAHFLAIYVIIDSTNCKLLLITNLTFYFNFLAQLFLNILYIILNYFGIKITFIEIIFLLVNLKWKLLTDFFKTYIH